MIFEHTVEVSVYNWAVIVTT